MRSNTKLILSLINRVAVRLPINSGRKIESLEQDPIVQQTVAAIIELSQYKLSTIANALGTVLENVSKNYQSPTPAIDQHVPLDVLQSQLFVLRLLSACMQHQWKMYRSGSKQQQQPDLSNSVEALVAANATGAIATSISTETEFLQAPVTVGYMRSQDSTAPIDSVTDGDETRRSSFATTSPENNHSNSYNRQQQNIQARRDLADPPPLDEALVTFILALIGRFLTQAHILEETLDQQSSTPSEYPLDMLANNFNLDPKIVSLTMDIYKTAGRVLYYVSASNWSTYYTKIKNAVHVLGAMGEGVEVNPPEIRLLECSCLTRQRVHTVLAELSPYFLHMKRQGKLLFSKMMRRAIWRWIEAYPSQFAEVCTSDNRLLSGSEILFDMCSSNADNPRKKAILWPLQTILLALSQDLLLQAFLDNPTSQNRRTSFLSILRKSLRTSKTADIAAVCYVDLCKAATYVPPTDDCVLRHIAADIEDELQEKVWDFSRNLSGDMSNATALGYVINQQALATDYLLARIRLDPDNTLSHLVPQCLEENAPIVFKQAFVKSCLELAREEQRLPWNPSITSMYKFICTPLRKLFLQTMNIELASKDTTSSALPPSLSGAMRKPPLGNSGGFNRKDTAALYRGELLQDLLRLFRVDPMLALLGNDTDSVEDNAAIMAGMASLFQNPDQTTRLLAGECLAKLHQPNNVVYWGSEQRIMINFWRISSKVVFILAKQILDNKQGEEGIKALLHLLMKLFETRNSFLGSNQDRASEGADARERLQASVALEIALLVTLCSANPDVCSDAIKCLGFLCDEARLVDEEEDPQQSQITLICNLPVYTDLAAEDSVFLGRKAQQKRIRKYMRLITRHTPGNLAAWEEVWKRWKALTQMVSRPVSEEMLSEDNAVETSPVPANNKKIVKGRATMPTASAPPAKSPVTIPARIELDDEKQTLWQNYTGFLAALGGCCLTPNLPESKSGVDSRRISAPTEPAALVEAFISEMTALLVSENVFIREGVKEILGSDSSLTLYTLLFRHLERHMTRCFDPAGEAVCTARSTLFVEQAVLVLKLILDRLVDPSDCLLSIDFSTLIEQFARYLNKLPNSFNSLRIKIKMCHLVETLMLKKEQIVVRDEMRLRNKLLELIVEWTSDFALQKPDHKTGYQLQQDVAQNEKLHKDLDQACMKAIVALLKQLPLQVTEPVREADTNQIKGRLFYKYFTFFLKLLNRCRLSEMELSSAAVVKNNKEVLTPAKATENYQDFAPLKDLTIWAMSNLLSANVDAGLKYSLAMGYHEDLRTRNAFMQVLTNILNQGTEFETLAESVMTDRYEKLIDMLVEADMEVAMALCDVCPSTDAGGVAETMLTAFESREKVFPLLKAAIRKEIESTEQEATLFRSTTMSTRLLSVFAKQVCGDFVRVTLEPAMEAINALPDDQTTWELDPQKLGPNDNLMRNKENVIRATEILLNAICSSAAKAPPAFRMELSLIAEAVYKRFSEAKYTAVGGFVFLRLFGPAIVTPDIAGFSKLATPRNKNVRKLQLQATRVIQNLANNVFFGSKETHMIVLNDFVTDNIYKVTSFLREISTIQADQNQAEKLLLNAVRMDQKGYNRLHRYLFENLERMSRELASRKVKGGSADTQSLLEWKKTLDRLSTLIAQLGRPNDIAQNDVSLSRNYAVANSNHHYSEFIRRNSHRDVSPISSKSIFYQAGTSRSGRPVFYLVYRNIDVENFDFELLVYYMLRVLEPFLNRPFEFVFDSTRLNPSCEIPPHWLNQFFQLIFTEMTDYLLAIHIYNPSTESQRYMSKLPRPLANKLIKRAHFYVTLAEFYEAISPSEVHLPKETIDLEKAPSTTFFPVSRVINLKSSSTPVTLKIGQEHIQIITVRKQEFYGNLYTVFNDVYHVSEIDDMIALPNSKGDSNGEFMIKYDRGKSSMVLSASKRDAILALLRYNKNRYEASKPGGLNERAIRPNDVPGRLLNMSLLNIGSEDPGLRLAAYNLLYALSLTFRFDIGNQLLNAQDLCIPANSTEFIVSISESLSSTESHLTLEFLNECLVGFNKSNDLMRQLCLDYMAPWLRNLALYCRHNPDDNNKNLTKTKDVIRLLIEMTVTRADMYKHMQAKVWKTFAQVDDMVNLIIDSFVQYSVEHGVGSPQAEVMADTIVTMSSISVRGKVISRLRRVIQRSSLRPSRSLTEHPAWTEIAILLRFVLMLSFNNVGPGKPYLPEIFHIVSLLVGAGPTLIRTSVHELVVNMIHTLCTSMPQSEESVKKLHYVLNDVCDSKNRVYFGLTKPHANAFTITQETMSDVAESVNLSSLESIIRLLLDALSIGAPSIDVANMWRARWMGLVTSTAFQFNPAIQPRSFVVLGCLAQDEVDDDLIYQVLVALRGALAIFNETDSNLIVSIMMCLSNVIDNLPADSRYLRSLFWLAISLVQMRHQATFTPAVEFLQSVLRALDAHNLFSRNGLVDVLMDSRAQLGDIAKELDMACGVSFDTHFSFAVAGVLLKGIQQNNAKEVVFQCLTTFLEIDCKRSMEQNVVEARTLGYLAGLLPLAAKNNTLRELLRLAGINDFDLDSLEIGTTYVRIFDSLEIPDNTTALLLVSLLVTLLNSAESESERLFLYSFLSEAAVSIPEVFALVYESLLPKMNQIVVSGQSYAVIDAVKNILITACSESAFAHSSTRRSQKAYLEELGFSALADPTFGAAKTNTVLSAQLASKLLERITE
ncbi:hypothetical protein BX666DRAFT_2026794 [Dichotomocladium elegans]|nr:hypothetical protein BX666DRAFT_2026794 [Dichotomocladium elegans]